MWFVKNTVKDTEMDNEGDNPSTTIRSSPLGLTVVALEDYSARAGNNEWSAQPAMQAGYQGTNPKLFSIIFLLKY